MSSGFFRGTNTEQDSRWGDAEKKLLRRTKFSKVLEQKVNMKKVNMDVMQRWIAQRITSLLGFDDDIVVGTCVNYLSEEGTLDPKKLQLQLTGFLEKSTGMFMEELWGLLLDAQSSLGGIPSAFLQDKKEEMLRAKEEERRRELELLQKMAEHAQEMETAASMKETAAEQNGTVAGSAPQPRPAEGRRASRWGSSAATVVGTLTPAKANVDTTPSAEIRDQNSQEDIADTPVPASPRPEKGFTGNQSDPERLDSGQVSKQSRSRRDLRDEDGPREKKRRSKSKHGKKKHDRKKTKKAHKSEEKEQRRSSHRDDDDREDPLRASDEGSSSEDEEDKPAVDMEETLRLKALASLTSKRAQQSQGDPK